MSNDFTAARVALIQSVRTWSTPEEVAKAIAVASETERHLYVERRGDAYRWSLAHKGGAYPLLRITARFLGVDYRSIFIGFRTLSNGYSVICENHDDLDEQDGWCVLELDGLISEPDALALIVRRAS